MAKVVFAAGASHSPILTFGSSYWAEYSQRDTNSKKLNTSTGEYISYDQLLTRNGPRYQAEAAPSSLSKKEKHCQDALDRLTRELEEVNPDVILILTDDETELFSRAILPAVAIYYGDTIVTRPFSSKQLDLDNPPSYFEKMVRGYAMDKPRSFPAKADFGYDLIERLIQKHIDVSAVGQIDDPQRSGFGHGVGFIIDRLLKAKSLPVLPILFNTYYPPNAPLPSRCLEIGRALRQAIDESVLDYRVAVIASGGLSHVVVDEELDLKVLKALRRHDTESLSSLPVCALNGGSSEIRNWIVLAGMLEGFELSWEEYQPLYRTPAGTGVGAAFSAWRPQS